ncbi:MAG TPA: hemerythrin domain-containing protein [Polyangia bacterium]|nr:hemerythrin domain-containing protein [Polyangia bacterium]
MANSDDRFDAVQLIERQHQQVRDLFVRLDGAKGRARKRVFDELATLLVIHLELEERLFYPELRRGPLAERVLRAAEEHLSVRRVLADLLDLELADETWKPKLQVMREQLELHLDEEEREILPRVRRELGREGLAALGQEMLALQISIEESAEGAPLDLVLDETERPAPA